jgi:hypothetical protein
VDETGQVAAGRAEPDLRSGDQQPSVREEFGAHRQREGGHRRVGVGQDAGGGKRAGGVFRGQCPLFALASGERVRRRAVANITREGDRVPQVRRGADSRDLVEGLGQPDADRLARPVGEGERPVLHWAVEVEGHRGSVQRPGSTVPSASKCLSPHRR